MPRQRTTQASNQPSKPRTRFGLLLCLLLAGAMLAQTYNPQAVAQAELGLTHSKNANYWEAIQAYNRAIAIDSGLPGIYLNLGLAWFKLGDFREALAAFDKQNKIEPGEQVSTLIAMSYFGLGQYREAADHLARVAQPGNMETSYLLAKCYLWSGRYSEAMDIFRKLLQRDPTSAAVHMLLGEALDAYYRTDEAAAEFELAAKAAPAQPDVHFGLGYLYWKLKRYDDAERQFREELKQNANHAHAMEYLGDVLMKGARADEAIDLLKKVTGLQKESRVAHLDLGILYAQRKSYEPAISEFREAIRTDPTSFAAHYRLARLYSELGRTADAEAEFAIVKTLHEKKVEDPLTSVGGIRK